MRVVKKQRDERNGKGEEQRAGDAILSYRWMMALSLHVYGNHEVEVVMRLNSTLTTIVWLLDPSFGG